MFYKIVDQNARFAKAMLQTILFYGFKQQHD